MPKEEKAKATTAADAPKPVEEPQVHVDAAAGKAEPKHEDVGVQSDGAPAPKHDAPAPQQEAPRTYAVVDQVRLTKAKHIKYKDCLAEVTKIHVSGKGEMSVSLKVLEGDGRDEVIKRPVETVSPASVQPAGPKEKNDSVVAPAGQAAASTDDVSKVFGASVPDHAVKAC